MSKLISATFAAFPKIFLLLAKFPYEYEKVVKMTTLLKIVSHNVVSKIFMNHLCSFCFIYRYLKMF